MHGWVSMLATLGYIIPERNDFFEYSSLPQYLKFTVVPDGLEAIPKVPTLGWVQALRFAGFIDGRCEHTHTPELMMAIIGIFFRDSSAGLALGDWAGFMGSPMRPPENELGMPVPVGASATSETEVVSRQAKGGEPAAKSPDTPASNASVHEPACENDQSNLMETPHPRQFMGWVDAVDGYLAAIHSRIDGLDTAVEMNEANVKQMRSEELMPINNRISDIGMVIKICEETINNLHLVETPLPRQFRDWVDAVNGDLAAIHSHIDVLDTAVERNEVTDKHMQSEGLMPIHNRIDDIGKAIKTCEETVNKLQDGPAWLRTAIESQWADNRQRDGRINRLIDQLNVKVELLERGLVDQLTVKVDLL